jgi:hypothetical protein
MPFEGSPWLILTPTRWSATRAVTTGANEYAKAVLAEPPVARVCVWAPGVRELLQRDVT